MKEGEQRITRKGMLVTAAGGAGALALLVMGGAKEANAEGISFVKIVDTDGYPVNPASEGTLALIKTNTTGLLKSTDVLNVAQSGVWNVGILGTVPVSGSLGRTWTITEVVPISHANLDVALSTLAKESGGNLATLTAKDFATQTTLALIKAKTDNLDAALSTLATQATLALIKAKTDNLDVLLSTIATQATLALIKAKTDNLDAALSTLATATGQSATQPRNITQVSGTALTARNWSTDFSKLDVALSTLATATGQSATQPRNVSQIAGTALTGRDWSTDFSKLDVALSTRLKIADYVLTQELGRVGLILTAGGAIVDPRQVRTFTITDSLEARPGNSTKTLAFASIDVAASGDNTIVAADASNKIKVTDYSIVCDAAVAARWKSGASTNLSGAMSFAANGGIMAAAGAGRWLFETAVNQALVLNLGAAVGARGNLTYFKEAS